MSLDEIRPHYDARLTELYYHCHVSINPVHCKESRSAFVGEEFEYVVIVKSRRQNEDS